jgi:hypothetical protein
MQMLTNNSVTILYAEQVYLMILTQNLLTPMKLLIIKYLSQR